MASTPFNLFTLSVTWTPYTASSDATTGLPTLSAGTAATIRAAIQPSSSSESMANDRHTGRTQATMYTSPSHAIKIQDTITWNSRVWRVVGGNVDQAGLGVVKAWALESEE